ncbi:hypothetical protein RHSIM_Rhsim11G0031000 [Rhododendron simsii]|uniref:CCHC-type domain-containing protein n=1 Tax=Rhododendron simsii TaxID=118357 RepID=A0A834G802_RHOSS|nr:hypothetical protein RHSIM_Rhsim11G0031000 [Rhododendron simsii]
MAVVEAVQGSRSVDDYTTEFHQLVVRNDVAERRSSWFQEGLAIGEASKPQANRVGASGSKCLKCGKPGHRADECRKGDRLGKALFVDANGIVNEQYEQEAAYDESQPSSDSSEGVAEEVVGDVGPLLDRFPEGEYNKLKTRKIGPVEVIEKINLNAYRLKLPSHVRTADVFNVKHLVPFRGDSSSDEDANFEGEFLSRRGG